MSRQAIFRGGAYLISSMSAKKKVPTLPPGIAYLVTVKAWEKIFDSLPSHVPGLATLGVTTLGAGRRGPGSRVVFRL